MTWAQTTRVDILVVYTPAVRTFWGGPNGVEAQLLATFAVSNKALADSEVDVVFNLVHAAELDYTEAATLDADLDAVTDTDDGQLDSVHALRNQYGADHVALMRRGQGTDSAGRAFLLSSESGSPATGFSVFADDSGAAGFVFAHELGHNLGLMHARGETGSTNGIRAFGRGYNFTGSDNENYRTIMSIGNGTRIGLFSNPDLTFAGVPLGIAADQSNSADSAGALRIGAPIVAGYRAEQPALPEFFVQPLDQTVVAGENAIISAAVNGLPPLSLQWFSGESGDTTLQLSGSTSDSVTLEAIQGTRQIWLEATTADGSEASRTVQVNVVTEPAGPFPQVLENVESPFSGFDIDTENFQQFTPPVGYVDRIEIGLFKSTAGGEPSDAAVRIVDPEGLTIFTGSIPASSINTFSTKVSIPVKRFVQAGATYALEIERDGPAVPNSAILWQGDDGVGPEPGNNIQQFFEDWQFSLDVYGTDATTYTAWQRDEGIAEAFAAGFDDALNEAGIPNGVLYASGLDLHTADFAALPSVGITDGGSEIVIRYQVRAHAVDVTAVPQASETPENFSNIPSATATPVENPDPDVDSFEVRIPLSSLDPETASRFFRLNFELPD